MDSSCRRKVEYEISSKSNRHKRGCVRMSDCVFFFSCTTVRIRYTEKKCQMITILATIWSFICISRKVVYKDNRFKLKNADITLLFGQYRRNRQNLILSVK